MVIRKWIVNAVAAPGAAWFRTIFAVVILGAISAACLSIPSVRYEDGSRCVPEIDRSKEDSRGGAAAADGRWAGPGLRPMGMAGEFEPQTALLLACDELVREHAATFSGLVTAAHRHVRLIGLVSDGRIRRKAERLLAEAGLPKEAMTFVRIPQETTWIRDYGPFFVKLARGGAAVVDSDRSFRGSEGDERVPSDLSQAFGLPRIGSPLAIEGGNLLANGDGLCLTSTSVMEPGMPGTREAVAGLLDQHFGFERWVYLQPPEWDEAQHVDMFVTFLAPDVAVVARADKGIGPADAQILDNAAKVLAKEQTSLGPMKVWRVPLGDCRDGVFRTYTNIVITDHLVLVPIYSNDDPETRKEVLKLYSELLPGRKVVGVKADSLASQGGALRCMSMNVPGFVRFPKLGLRPITRIANMPSGAMFLKGLKGPAVLPFASTSAKTSAPSIVVPATVDVACGR